MEHAMEHAIEIPLDEMFGNLTTVEININDAMKSKKFKEVNEFERWLQNGIGRMYITKNRWTTMAVRGVVGYVQINNIVFVAIPLKKEVVADILDIPYKVVE